MNLFATGFSWIAQYWWIGLVVCAFAIWVTWRRTLETDQARAHRAQRKQNRYLRALADRISAYGRNVHQHYPTGDVVVSVPDLAEQLGTRPEAVASALKLLFFEQKVQRISLKGYWKLNI